MDFCIVLIKCVMIAFSAVYIVDISGIMGKLNRVVFRALYGGKMPLNGWYIPLLGCSVCVSFWAVLIYATFIAKIGFIYALALASLFGYIAPISGDILRVVRAKVMQRISTL